MIRFTVPGQPLPTARPRTGKRGGRPYTPKASLEAQARVAAAYRVAYPDRAVDDRYQWMLDVICYRETRSTADVDNLTKTVLDGLQGVLFENDSQVADLHVRRHLGVGKGNGRTLVAARPLTPLDGECATLGTHYPNGGIDG